MLKHRRPTRNGRRRHANFRERELRAKAMAQERTRQYLNERSWLEFFPRWLAPSASEALFGTLSSSLSFEQHSVTLFGKRVPQPRLIAWCGSHAYEYTGLSLPPRPIPTCLAPVWERVNEQANVLFNHVLANLYRDGNDSMGMHADDERELGAAPIVACLSLGQERTFVLRARRGSQTVRLGLSAGSLLVMGGNCQHEFVHGVPKTKRAVGARMSLTFRTIHPPAAPAFEG